MSLRVEEDFVHKNRGLKVNDVKMVRLTRVDLGTIQMKTKCKVGPVDRHIAEIPKDECVSRLVNWRKLLKAGGDPKTQPGPESNPRKVAFVFDGHQHGKHPGCDYLDWQVSGGRSCSEEEKPDQLLMASIWVGKDDPQIWDSEPSDWPGEGWVPFFVAFRPKGEPTEEDDDEA